MFQPTLIRALFTIKKRQNYSRQQILAVQEKQFRNLLSHTWDHSPFYRKLYQSQGIKKSDLTHIALTDLPFTTKEILMEHFDEAVTDKRLKREELQQFIKEEQDVKKLYLGKYVIVNTSGTTGNVGIFVYDNNAWATIRASAVMRVSRPKFKLGKKTKIAFFGATNGRFGGISFVKHAPKFLYDIRFFSLLSPTSQVIHDLNIFQPEQLSGYSSAISNLAEEALTGKLTISPKIIVVSGDPLTEKMEKIIKKAWNVPVMNYYATTEALCIAARLPDSKTMSIFDDTHIVEILDKKMQEVTVGETGQIVITSLYNYALPLIRYQLRDLAIKGKTFPTDQFGSIEEIIGRVNDALPITLDNGKLDTLNPVMLAGFFVQGMQKFQFVSYNPKKITVKYIAKKKIDADVLSEFLKLLQAKSATKLTKVDIERVISLPNDSKTGKFKLVVKVN